MNDTVYSFEHTGSPAGDPLHYTACGLDNIYLTSGYQVRRIGDEDYVSVRDVEDLHAAIAVFLMGKKTLAGKEIRFLRKNLDLTQRELGDLMCVSDQSIARYEKGQTALEGAADTILRLLVLGQTAGCLNVREELERIRAADDVSGETLTLERSQDEWRVAA